VIHGKISSEGTFSLLFRWLARTSNWGEPERAPHYCGLRDHVHRPTDRVRPIHVILIHCMCQRCQAAMPHSCPTWTLQCVVEIATRLRTATMGKCKADTRLSATNCEAGTRDQRTSWYLRFLVSVAMHPWVFTYVSFSRRLLHTNPFSHSYMSTTRAYCILDKTYRHVMHTGLHRPHPLT